MFLYTKETLNLNSFVSIVTEVVLGKKKVFKLQSEFIYSEKKINLLEEPLTTVLHKIPSHFVSLILCI